MGERRRSQVSPRTVWTVGLNALALAGTLWLGWRTWHVLRWVLLAAFLALAADPLVRWWQRRGLRRGWAVLVTVLGGLGLLGALVATVVPMLVDQVSALVWAVPGWVESLQHQEWVQGLDERFQVVSRLSQELRTRLPRMAMPALGVVTEVLWRVVGLVSVVVLTVFFLLFGGEVFGSVLEWVEPSRRQRWRHLAGKMHREVGGYVAGLFIVSSIGGVVTTVTMLALGVPYFLPLGLLVAVLGLIPFLGAALSAVMVVGTTFASAGRWQGLVALAVFLVYQQAENHLLQPLIQRRTLKMNPLIIALVMLVGTSLAGLLGTLLALPVAGAVKVLIQEQLALRQERWKEPASVSPRLPPPVEQEAEARH